MIGQLCILTRIAGCNATGDFIGLKSVYYSNFCESFTKNNSEPLK